MKTLPIVLLSALLACGACPRADAATPSLVVDAETLEVLHADRAGAPWYPASTTKLMTAFVVFEHLKSGKTALQSDVVFSARAVRQESGKAGLRPGDGMTVEAALAATIAVSSNEAAVALAETIAGSEADFARLMNAAAARLGMTASHFTNASGLFDGRHVSSARDLAVLAVAIERNFPDYMPFFQLSRIILQNGSDSRTIRSNNSLLTRFPGAIGMKNGFVCASGRNLVTLAARNGRKILAVVLGATTGTERDERMAELLDKAFAGALAAKGPALSHLKNADGKPEDLRPKLCGKDAAAYVRAQERLYPLGLAGRKTYLSPPAAPKSYRIQVRPAKP